MKKECIECKSSYRGRSDKKFCSSDCRSSYHNKRYRDRNKLMRNINNCLRRNRGILRELVHQKAASIERTHLLQKGFSFQFVTHIEEDAKMRKIHFCYDVGYYEKDEHVFLIS